MKFVTVRKWVLPLATAAVLLLLLVPVAQAWPFGDVPVGHWAYNAIQRVAYLHITAGCGGGNYCPDDYVTRAQMAGFMNNLTKAWTDQDEPYIISVDHQYQVNDRPAIVGRSKGGSGLEGYSYGGSYADNGVYGETNSTASGEAGVYGRNTGAGAGVLGWTSSTTTDAKGVFGQATASSGRTYGVWGETASSTQNSCGVVGRSSSTSGDVKGVIGETFSTSGGVAVVGTSWGNRHAGWFQTGNWVSTQILNNSATMETLVVTNNGGGPTGFFGGAVQVTGDVSSAGGTLRIDHPLDPANKYLNHSFVESPDRMNVYNGNAVLDANGEAVVELPGYFEALNQDFRYQLTPIGAPAPNLYIAEEITGNRFKIAGGPPGIKVSWQVTGIRGDPWAKANPILVEEDKSPQERGYYVHPEAYGQPDSADIKWLRVPEKMIMVKDQMLPATSSQATGE